jgi:diguanylate cyclase (GGDEF)-like protein
MTRIESKATVTSIAAKLPSPDTVRLTLTLQTTLDLGEMLAILAREAAAFTSWDGLTLRAPQRGLELEQGNPGKHRCGYNLFLMDEELAEIEFSRNRRFGEAELAGLETLLSALLYPLRNALAYRDALRAAYKDPLTGVGSRLAFEEAVPREITLARRHGHTLALLVLDLDHFKQINDQYGHQAGDCVLRSAARRMAGSVRTSDQVFRIGGEEFAVVLNNTTEAGAVAVAERIRLAVAGAMTNCADHMLQITVSIGAAMLKQEDDLASLFGRADAALYRSKSEGRNRVEFHGNLAH